MKRVAILVSGKVQGVFFRATAKDVADRLGVVGFVKNQPDGNVYLEAEGEDAKVDAFVDWCRKGPPRGHVSGIKIEAGIVEGNRSFRIER